MFFDVWKSNLVIRRYIVIKVIFFCVVKNKKKIKKLYLLLKESQINDIVFQRKG